MDTETLYETPAYRVAVEVMERYASSNGWPMERTAHGENYSIKSEDGSAFIMLKIREVGPEILISRDETLSASFQFLYKKDGFTLGMCSGYGAKGLDDLAYLRDIYIGVQESHSDRI